MSDDPIETPAAPAPTTPAPSPAPATAPSAGAADDIDALLADYTAQTGSAAPATPDGGDLLADLGDAPARQPPAQPPHTDSPDMLALYNWAIAVETERQMERDARDGSEAIAAIRGEVPAEMYPDEMVGAWIKTIAQTNPKVQAAWQNRARDPQSYQRAVTALAQRFHKEHGQLPDKQATEDREMVTAAVRGAGGKPPEPRPPNYGTMSSAEFRKSVRDQYGYEPGVS